MGVGIGEFIEDGLGQVVVDFRNLRPLETLGLGRVDHRLGDGLGEVVAPVLHEGLLEDVGRHLRVADRLDGIGELVGGDDHRNLEGEALDGEVFGCGVFGNLH